VSAPLTTATRENDPPDRFLILAAFKADDSFQAMCQFRQPLMACISVWQPLMLTRWQTVNVRPITRNIYADDDVF